MIQRIPKSPAPVSEDETPAGPSKLVDVTIVEFNFGPNDAISFTLAPEDRLNVNEPDVFVVHMAARGDFGEETVTIERARVRWRSQRTGKIAVPPDLFQPPGS